MTAYTFTKAPALAKDIPHGVIAAFGQYNVAAAVADDDTFGDIPVPKGAVILDTILETNELDTNGSPTLTFNVGIFADGSAGTTNDEDAFVDGALCGAAYNRSNINVGSVSGGVIATGSGYKVTGESAVVRITADGAPATGATSGYIKLAVLYTMDPQ